MESCRVGACSNCLLIVAERPDGCDRLEQSRKSKKGASLERAFSTGLMSNAASLRC